MGKTYDAIIIGSGQAGFPLAAALAGKGWKVALAEGGHIGGTCINTGCSPTKTIVASARAAHVARRGADFGVITGPVSIDFAKVMERKDKIVHQFRSGVEDWLTSLDNLTLYREYASFEGPNQVRVGDEVIESERIYINTGARTTVPPIPGLDGVPYLDNKTILELEAVPQHLVVIGGGYIGLEYAQAFRRFGAEVTVIERAPQIMGREDADIARAALELMEGEGLRVLLNTKTVSVEPSPMGVRVHVESDGHESVVEGSHLLLAVGRTPNSDKLALDKAGIKTDQRGYITVDDHLLTSAPGVWALGDVNGRGAFTHTSWNDHEIVLDNLDGGTRSLAERITVYGVYVDPPLGRVGMSEQDVRASGRKALIGVKPMSDIARAKERDETTGLMKVLVDAETKQFLGAAIFGIGGDEIVHSIIDLMYAKAPYTVMKNAVHVHPTVSELLPTLLGELKPLE
ncbi:MAG: FAD-containing oxidoreductase [Anaerolineae bacterium]|jgi:pyruvate/2-oxoglutarate dehydrogenase complex dihydrolipoamide dehydrogenase (E3) component|nr:FAD-containing oxidoreductase [Anaerolineae bacterium]